MGNFCFREEPFSNKEQSVLMEEDFQNDTQVTSSHQQIRLADFTTIMVLGQGAYGKVYLVEHTKTRQRFAMKALNKSDIKKDSQIRHVHDERQILEKVNSQFLVKLRYAFQTSHKLYLVVDYMSGGELFYHLKKQKKFPEVLARFYAAEMALGIGYMHSQNIIYRDLKPENILLDGEGHLKLADFGLSKLMYTSQERVYTMCGTPEYIAPEVLVATTGYDKVCDWWSYGCLVYEMFVGFPPFYSKDKRQMLRNRMQKPIPYPESIPPNAREFLQGLLQTDPKKRLGFNGVEEVKNASFFEGLSWPDIQARHIDPPYNFDKSGFTYFDKNMIAMNPASEVSDSACGNSNTKEKMHFSNFTYEQYLIQKIMQIREFHNRSHVSPKLFNN